MGKHTHSREFLDKFKFNIGNCVETKNTNNNKIPKQKFLFALIALASLYALVSANPVNNGRYSPDLYYNGQYFKNRDYYNQRRYYDSLLKKYNAGVAAQESRVVEQKVVPISDGNFAYEFDTNNGIHADARGSSIYLGGEEPGQKIDGSFAYISPEGLRVGVRYTADENGYRPVYTYDGIDAPRYANAPEPADVQLTHIQ
ncbi:cuticle protein 2-like [Stomoxys calcitrans]|uniref:Cuticle protein n=1 Tax=Stomoxys calcitrans TaxID=35570 RepID=A0A1I8PRW4_STOCA|nr:cuticle protein 2-like [Stomoxys calcitrans]